MHCSCFIRIGVPTKTVLKTFSFVFAKLVKHFGGCVILPPKPRTPPPPSSHIWKLRAAGEGSSHNLGSLYFECQPTKKMVLRPKKKTSGMLVPPKWPG